MGMLCTAWCRMYSLHCMMQNLMYSLHCMMQNLQLQRHPIPLNLFYFLSCSSCSQQVHSEVTRHTGHRADSGPFPIVAGGIFFTPLNSCTNESDVCMYCWRVIGA